LCFAWQEDSHNLAKPFGVVELVPIIAILVSLFLAQLPGRSRHAARGVSHIQSIYFVFVLLYFTLFTALFAFYIKNTKK
jgi:hypothetical protein